ncbi:MAG: ArnT family glycosyltransferase [Chthonomonadales bacterium]
MTLSHSQTARPAPTSAWILLAIAGIAAVLLRVIALASDPYAGLDWSSGLLTDEGFYIHNARNAVLFGHAITDGFNNMFLSPLLHLVQVAVFRLAGVGSVQARSISVGCGLAAVGVLYCGLRRAFDVRTALAGAAFLGLDHVFVLFNRMALMDTPAALLAVCSFYAFVRAAGAGRARAGLWFALCGLFIGAAVVTRGLCLYLVAAPAAGIAALGPGAPRKALSIAAGALLVLAWYIAAWYLPHAAEIRHMNAYYLHHQILPGSLLHLAQNLYHGLLGDRRGIVPYLFRHTPVLWVLAATAGAAALLRSASAIRASVQDGERGNPSAGALRFLAAWFCAGMAALAAVSYSPGRYSVTLWPALCGLAATAFFAPGVPQQLWRDRGSAGLIALAAIAWVAAYHADEALFGREGPIRQMLLYLLPSLAAASVLLWKMRGYAVPAPGAWSRWMVFGAAALWIIVDAAWLADWAGHIRYAQRDLSLWLGSHVPARAAALGDVAPGLCMDNRLKAVSVIPGLCNDADPLARFRGEGTVIAIMDGVHQEKWWVRTYPGVVKAARRIRLARVIKWDIGIYPVQERRSP